MNEDGDFIAIIPGHVVSKKTSQKIIRIPRRGFRISPSDRYRKWESDAVIMLQALRPAGGPIDYPVNLTARIHRRGRPADLINLLESIADALERAEIIKNDSLITGFDGSRIFEAGAIEYVEIYLSPLRDLRFPISRSLFREDAQ